MIVNKWENNIRIPCQAAELAFSQPSTSGAFEGRASRWDKWDRMGRESKNFCRTGAPQIGRGVNWGQKWEKVGKIGTGREKFCPNSPLGKRDMASQLLHPMELRSGNRFPHALHPHRDDVHPMVLLVAHRRRVVQQQPERHLPLVGHRRQLA